MKIINDYIRIVPCHFLQQAVIHIRCFDTICRMKTISLNADASIPVLGFGTWQLTGDTCVAAVTEALHVGYRHIDTADAYGNHVEVLAGIRKSGISRSDLFITTKLRQGDGYKKETVRKSGERFLKELDTDYIDLLLIHWPDRSTPFQETLHAMEELRKEGKIRAIGVSNFTQHHIEDALKTGIEVTNNQVEIHPAFNQKKLRAFCASKGIVVTAYSPLGHGFEMKTPLLQELAQKYRATPAQISINWVLSRDMVTIPKSAHPARIKENFDAQFLTIEEADLARIDAIPKGLRVCEPEFADFSY